MSSIEITNKKLLSMNSKIKVIETDVDSVKDGQEHTNINAMCKIDTRLEKVKKKFGIVYDNLKSQIDKTRELIDIANKRIASLESLENALPIDIPTSSKELLYIILPYFNYCSFKKRTTLFIDFIERYKNTSGIRIVVVEGILQDSEEQLPTFKNGVFMHLKVKLIHSNSIRKFVPAITCSRDQPIHHQ